MNSYYEKLKDFSNEIEKSVKTIFAVYGNELLLRIEEYNLLANPNNAVESSTAIGYLIEEFIVSKLELYTKTAESEAKISRMKDGATTEASYDCFSVFRGIKALVNIKVNKRGSANNAIAAINKLLDDYLEDSDQEKCYMILKIHYGFGQSRRNGDKNRKILIDKVETFFLEEIDFSEGHQQDHRNWSRVFNPNSGRLQVSNKFRRDHCVSIENISYQNTCKMLRKEFVKALQG